jgi:hypothetical protein
MALASCPAFHAQGGGKLTNRGHGAAMGDGRPPGEFTGTLAVRH